ncbi:hypothetical protein NC99_43320 [Sunxiuqinia dokdonensis]|uniref:Uncharacterized protein n=1 Tax=Sunxiuqinia dokdonensis TaxID=1409788 RepID=A0A0L8V3A2_9BACT|nr:hypothetical protein NC99_43320 [Sunxiuqinia dokdonensis]
MITRPFNIRMDKKIIPFFISKNRNSCPERLQSVYFFFCPIDIEM